MNANNQQEGKVLGQMPGDKARSVVSEMAEQSREKVLCGEDKISRDELHMLQRTANFLQEFVESGRGMSDEGKRACKKIKRYAGKVDKNLKKNCPR